MEPIPESWPPDDSTKAQTAIVPLFALPHVWLFPYVILPLHVFEDRYKQMVEDILDGPGRIVLGTVQDGHEDDLAGEPPVYSIAGLGEIGRHERLEDGRFNIILVGLKRVRINETESDRAYRKVEIESADEIAIPREREDALRKRLIDNILQRTDEMVAIPPQITTSHLVDLLTLRMQLPHAVINELYCELDVERRAENALRQHEAHPKIDPPKKEEQDEGEE